MFTLNRVYKDEYGRTQVRRVHMKAYRNEALARRRADEQKGGFLCLLGQNAPVYLGAWQ